MSTDPTGRSNDSACLRRSTNTTTSSPDVQDRAVDMNSGRLPHAADAHWLVCATRATHRTEPRTTCTCGRPSEFPFVNGEWICGACAWDIADLGGI